MSWCESGQHGGLYNDGVTPLAAIAANSGRPGSCLADSALSVECSGDCGEDYYSKIAIDRIFVSLPSGMFSGTAADPAIAPENC